MKKFSARFCTTDLASELFQAKKQAFGQSLPVYHTKTVGTICTETLTVSSEEASRILGKSIGTYYTIHTGALHLMGKETYRICTEQLSDAIRQAISLVLRPEADTDISASADASGTPADCRSAASPEWERGESPDLELSYPPTITAIPPEPEEEDFVPPLSSVLIAGLGNPSLTPDTFGPACLHHLHVTRHLTGEASPFPENLRQSLCAVSAVCPMVLGQTGIETLELVRAAADAVHPELVILIDALAASQLSSLASTIQISTTGIHPGGGLGSKRAPIVRETIGVPVITIGTPTVISASTLLYRTLEASGLLPAEGDASCEVLQTTLNDALCSYVTPKDIDTQIRCAARMTADALNRILLGDEMTDAFSVPV